MIPGSVSAPDVRRTGASGVVVAGIGIAAALSVIAHIGVGSPSTEGGLGLRMSPGDVLAQLFGGDDGTGASAIVWRIRLPRALACLLVGGSLGIVGSAFQALFRNPLADPFVVGVSSGAAAGGAIALWLGLGSFFGGLGLLAAAFVGGLLSLGFVMIVARHRAGIDVQSLLLAGVVVGSLLHAVVTLVLLAAGHDTNQILRWLLGSATPMYWNRVAALAIALAIGGIALALLSKRLNVLAMGEHAAQRLGVDTRRLRTSVLCLGTAITAVTVGSVGIIGFLGLVAPHIARRLVGVDWRWSLIASGGVGMVLLVLADLAAQWIMPGAEIPVGIVTALLGAPFLLALMRRA